MNQVLEFKEFDGGRTDNPIDCQPNQYQLADNFVILKNKKIASRPGSRRDNEAAAVVPTTPTRIGALIPFKGKLFKQRSDSLHYIESSVMQTLIGPTGNQALPQADDTMFASFSYWNGHFFITNDSLTIRPQKVYKNSSSAFQVNNAGLPSPSSGYGFSFGVGASSYIYRFVYKVSYVRDGNLTFEVRGAPYEVQLPSGAPAISGGAPVQITGFPTLSNGITDNYDTANVKIEIYRTIANGNQFYLVAEVANGALLYDDTTTDAALVDSTPLYTEGGVQENGEPPVCKFLHITEIAAYYAFIKDGSDTFENEIRQSKPGQPEAVPSNFSVTIEDEIKGLSSVRNIPIVFGASGIYRLDGVIDEFGNGAITPVKIASVGALNNLGIVQATEAIFFAGTDGFYETDGYRVVKLSNELNETYASYTLLSAQKERICGAFDIVERRILWGVQSQDGADCDYVFVCHLNFPRLDDGGRPFTNWHGYRLDDEYENLVTDWTVTALTFFEGSVYRATLDGYTFQHSAIYQNDERYTGSEWIKQPIQYDFKGAITSFGSASVRKWAPTFSICAEPTSNVSLLPQYDNDFTRSYKDCKEIRVRPLAEWGDGDWGDLELYGAVGALVNQKRNMQSGDIRCFFRQMRFRNWFASISASDYRGNAYSVTGTTVKTVVLAGTQVFPTDPIDYYLQLPKAGGGYTDPLLVIGQPAPGTLTVSDPSNEGLSGTDLKWQLKGFAKSDGLTLVSYAIYFKPLTPSQKPYTGDGGANNAPDV